MNFTEEELWDVECCAHSRVAECYERLKLNVSDGYRAHWELERKKAQKIIDKIHNER